MEAVKVSVAPSFVTVTLAGLIEMTLSVVCLDSHPTIANSATTVELSHVVTPRHGNLFVIYSLTPTYLAFDIAFCDVKPENSSGVS